MVPKQVPFRNPSFSIPPARPAVTWSIETNIHSEGKHIEFIDSQLPSKPCYKDPCSPYQQVSGAWPHHGYPPPQPTHQHYCHRPLPSTNQFDTAPIAPAAASTTAKTSVSGTTSPSVWKRRVVDGIQMFNTRGCIPRCWMRWFVFMSPRQRWGVLIRRGGWIIICWRVLMLRRRGELSFDAWRAARLHRGLIVLACWLKPYFLL